MKRTLSVMLVVGGMVLAIFTLLLGRQQQMLAMQDARTAGERAVSRRPEDSQPPLVGKEEEIVPPAKSDEQTIRRGDSVVEVELVFFGDKSRRAVNGLVFDSNAEWSLIAVNASATRAPADLPPTIDHVWVNDRSGRRLSAEYIGDDRDSHATIYQVMGPLPVADISDLPSKLTKGESLTALQRRLERSQQTVHVQTVQVVGVLSEQETSEWRRQKERGRFETPVPELIEFLAAEPLLPGTPLFRGDECVGLVFDTAELKGPEPHRSFATRTAPIRRNLQLFRQVASRRKLVPSASDDAVLSQQAVATNEAATGETTELKVFRLQNADASEALRVIRPLLPREAKVSADQRTNSLIVSTNADRLVIITALLIALDEAPGKKRLPPPMNNESLTAPNTLMTNRTASIAGQDAAMDREAKQLAVRVRAAKEPEKSKLRAELELLTDKHFELRQQRRAAEIAELADRVDKLRVAHQRRQENKPDILKRRLADLLDEENELKWDEARLKPTSPITQSKPEPQLPNLDGEWLVTLPAGFEFVGKIEKRLEGCWSFEDMRNLSGYYQLEGNTLKGVTTDKNEPRDYEWLILNDNVLVLTKAPLNIGSDYRGATLRRGAKPKSPLERSQSEVVPRSEPVLVAKLQKAEVVLKSAKVEFDRVQKLVESKSVSSAEVDRATALVAEAKADVDIAKAELEEARRAQPKGQ